MRKDLSVKRIVNSVYSSNTFVLTCSTEKGTEAWIIDIGDVDAILKILPANTLLKGVLFTHTHYDHIYGINKLLALFPCIQLVTNDFGEKALCSPKLNFSRYHQEATDLICDKPERIIVLKEPSIRLFDSVDAKVFPTPGHDASCLTYVIDKYVFSGDSYIPGVKTRSTYPYSDRKSVQSSENLIKTLSFGKILCPGHGIIYEDFKC
ncbi:MAG: MBL fold metallo-hydrolase [Candidatus Egerieousia sp.]